jgi:hypothetical protein
MKLLRISIQDVPGVDASLDELAKAVITDYRIQVSDEDLDRPLEEFIGMKLVPAVKKMISDHKDWHAKRQKP